MKFSELPYKRPDIKAVIDSIRSLINDFQNSSTAIEQIELMKKIAEARGEMETSRSIVSIRHSINTNDEFYDEENKFFDQNSPDYGSVINQYYKAINESEFKNELANEFGEHFLNSFLSKDG